MSAHHETAAATVLGATVEKDASSGPVTTSEKCVTCKAPRTGPYCAICGQRAMSQRHTLRSLADGVLRRLFDVERGLMYTVKRLTLDPGGVVRDYWAGRTVVYVHPFNYLIIAFAAFALTFRLTGGTGGGGMERVSTAAIIFFLAAASRIAFWRTGLNYAEHLVLNAFLLGHVVLSLTVAMLILAYFLPPLGLAIEAGIPISGACAYIVWGYSRTFRARPVLAALGGLLVILLGVGLWLVALIWVVRLARPA